jgi:ATP-dependent Clp protease ATP-binding subunit ClpA
MMFERFSKEARRVVEHAYEEARTSGAARLGTEHLLLGVAAGEDAAARALAELGAGPERLRGALREAGGLDGDALASIGIDLDEVRRRADASFGEGALARRGGPARRGRVPMSRRGKAALEGALREALERGDRQIGAEHVLLGLLRDERATAVRVLRRAGVEAAALREALRPVASRRGPGA